MTIKQRLSKINQIAKSSQTSLVFDDKRKHRTYHVRSVRNQKPYQILTHWSKDKIWQIQTQMWSYTLGLHKVSNCHTTICYQALGALKWTAQQTGKVLSFCKSKQAAQKLLNFGGQLIKITNLGQGVVWATIR